MGTDLGQMLCALPPAFVLCPPLVSILTVNTSFSLSSIIISGFS